MDRPDIEYWTETIGGALLGLVALVGAVWFLAAIYVIAVDLGRLLWRKI